MGRFLDHTIVFFEKILEYIFNVFGIHKCDSFVGYIEQFAQSRIFVLFVVLLVLFLFFVYVQNRVLSLLVLTVLMCIILRVDPNKLIVALEDLIVSIKNKVGKL